ncbi:MAG: hypothetical protein Q8P90_02685 [bacterium]|nr:hypothetical protein [bacterium]
MKKELEPLFDVIIVYDGLIAEGASDKSYRGRTPFSRTGDYFDYNKSYEYFLLYCSKLGLKAAFASTVDINEYGLFKAVWIFNKKWQRLHEIVEAKIVFDKFSNFDTYNAKYDTKLKNNIHGITYFHHPAIRSLFDNKIKTYNTFSKFSIPTAKINVHSSFTIASAKKILNAQIQKHTNTADFTELFVLKDQYGSGGLNVFKVKSVEEVLKIGKNDQKISYILQPLILATGFSFVNYKGYIDLRVIVCDGIITDCYIRIAKSGEFRANASRGGNVAYIPVKEIPKDVVKMSKSINAMLSEQDGFYALDFIKSNTGNLYFIEGNITPGLTWFNKKDEIQVKQLMRNIIQKIVTLN